MPINKCELFLINLEWQYRVDCSCDGAISRNKWLKQESEVWNFLNHFILGVIYMSQSFVNFNGAHKNQKKGSESLKALKYHLVSHYISKEKYFILQTIIRPRFCLGDFSIKHCIIELFNVWKY